VLCLLKYPTICVVRVCALKRRASKSHKMVVGERCYARVLHRKEASFSLIHIDHLLSVYVPLHEMLYHSRKSVVSCKCVKSLSSSAFLARPSLSTDEFSSRDGVGILCRPSLYPMPNRGVPCLDKARHRLSTLKGSVSVLYTTEGIGRTLPRPQAPSLNSLILLPAFWIEVSRDSHRTTILLGIVYMILKDCWVECFVVPSWSPATQAHVCGRE
jgi:hypothetical protein